MYVVLAHVSLIEDAEAMSQVSVLGCMAQRCPPQEEPGASHLLCPVYKNFLFPGSQPRKEEQLTSNEEARTVTRVGRAGVLGAVKTGSHSFLFRAAQKMQAVCLQHNLD